MILTSIFILINIFSSYFIFFYLIHKPVLLIAYTVLIFLNFDHITIGISSFCEVL